jgi:hypothetical protein
MRITLLFFLMLIIAASCGNDKQNAGGQQLTVNTDTIGIQDGYTGSNDTLHIDQPMIVFTWPDSVRAEQVKAADSEEFYTASDDYSFYNSQLMEVSDTLGIKNTSTSLKYLDFKFPNGKHWLLDHSIDSAIWGTYIYNGIDTPRLYFGTDDNKEFLKKYFKK